MPKLSVGSWRKGALDTIHVIQGKFQYWSTKHPAIFGLSIAAFAVYCVYKCSKFYSLYEPFFLTCIYLELGEYQLAIEGASKAIDRAKRAGNQLVEALAYFKLGKAHYSLGHYVKVIEYHEEALALFQNLGDQAEEASTYTSLGNAYCALGDNHLAIEYYEKTLAIVLSLGEQINERIAYTNLGDAHEALGNYSRAIECYERSLVITKALGDRAAKACIYERLGNAHRSLGNYAKVIQYYESSVESFRVLRDRAKEGQLLGKLGAVYLSLSNYAKAIELNEKELEIAIELKDRARISEAYGHLANLFYLHSKFTRAIALYEKVIPIFQALGDEGAEGAVFGNLGNIHASLGNYSRAIECHKRSLVIFQALGDRSREAQSYGNLGVVHSFSDNHFQSIEFYEKACAVAKELGERDSFGRAHSNLGASYIKLEDYSKAEKHYQIGTRAFSNLQHSLGKMYHAKITIFEEQSKAYFGLEKTFLLQHKHMDALVMSDSRRSRTLIDRIQTKLSLPLDSLDAPIQIEEMQDLAEKLGTTFVVFRFSSEGKADQAFGVWIIHPEQEIVYRTIKAPSIFNAMRGSGVTPFQDMDTSDTRGGVGLDSLFASLPSSDLVTEVEKEQIAFLQDWYNELIAPILDALPTEDDARITLVPDGPLMDLPFALLMDPEEKYLFEKYTISITSSIKALHLLTQRQISPSEKNLVVGNPEAPDMSPLPFSTKEAQRVSKITGTLPEHTLLEGEALKTTVLDKLENSRFIHLACHGFPKARDKFSIYDGAFYLTPDEKNPDGILYAEEIVSCDLNAELVLLSACQSGKGRQQREGVIGPVRSFLAAGAQAVVATLWELPDSKLTVDMVSQFYEHILGKSEIAQEMGRSLDKDEALREVMRMAASGPARNRPREWGAFFLTGALQPSPQNASSGKGEEV